MKFLIVIAFVAISIAEVLSEEDCTPLRCTLPVKPGDCDDSIEQYYFDKETKSCKTFTYTGCGGNVNRFRTQQLCENTCFRDRPNCPSTTTKHTTKRTTKRPTKKTTTTKKTTKSTTTKKTTKKTTKPTTTKSTTTTAKPTTSTTAKPTTSTTAKPTTSTTAKTTQSTTPQSTSTTPAPSG